MAPKLPAAASFTLEGDSIPVAKTAQTKKRAKLALLKAHFRCIILPPYCFYHSQVSCGDTEAAIGFTSDGPF